MSIITVAFFKGKNSYKDTLIKLWTNSEYSHVELIKDNKSIICLPSKGVYIKNNKIYNANDWTFININYDDSEHINNIFNAFINNELNCKYDWLGIYLSQFIKLGINSDSKWFCSELTTKLLQILLIESIIDLQPNKVSPGMLYNKLNQSL